MSAAPYPGYPAVAGYCPMGCGRTLFLGEGGHVTCSWIDCPDPGAADALLDIAPRPQVAEQQEGE